MATQYRFFSIPATNAADAEEGLNAFLKTVTMVDIQRELVIQKDRYYWLVAVEYNTSSPPSEQKNAPGFKKKIDYKELLSPEEFAVFAKLRDWRKEVAGKEGLQLYTVFRNDQLAAMVQGRMTTKEELGKIDGVGDARIEKYSDGALAILKQEYEPEKANHETGQASLPFDTNAGKPAAGLS